MPRSLCSHVARERAWKLLHSHWYAAWRALLRRSNTGRQEGLELIELTTYLVTFHFAELDVVSLVDGFEGHAVLFDLRRAELREKEQPLQYIPLLTAAQAVAAAQRVLSRARRASPRTKLREPVAEPSVEVIGYPYWAYYFERVSGKLDAKLLDAVTGQRAGPRLKSALLRALSRRAPGWREPSGTEERPIEAR
jgi:hypothetical protein